MTRSNPHYTDYLPKGFEEFRQKYLKLRRRNRERFKDLYVQFTNHQGDTLIRYPNQKPDHQDPAAVYAYPINYILDHPADFNYGAGAQWLRVLDGSPGKDRKLILQDVDKRSATYLLQRMFPWEDPRKLMNWVRRTFQSRVGKSIPKAFFQAVQTVYQPSFRHAEIRSGQYQTKLFIKAGVETIEDRAKSRSRAVINQAEPEQIAFLTRRAFDVVDIFRLTDSDTVYVSKESKVRAKAAAALADSLDDRIVSTLDSLYWTSKGRRIYVRVDSSNSSKHKERKETDLNIIRLEAVTERGPVGASGYSISEVVSDFIAKFNDSRLVADWEPDSKQQHLARLESLRRHKEEQEKLHKARAARLYFLDPLLEIADKLHLPFPSDWSDAQVLRLSEVVGWLKARTGDLKTRAANLNADTEASIAVEFELYPEQWDLQRAGAVANLIYVCNDLALEHGIDIFQPPYLHHVMLMVRQLYP